MGFAILQVSMVINSVPCLISAASGQILPEIALSMWTGFLELPGDLLRYLAMES